MCVCIVVCRDGRSAIGDGAVYESAAVGGADELLAKRQAQQVFFFLPRLRDLLLTVRGEDGAVWRRGSKLHGERVFFMEYCGVDSGGLYRQVRGGRKACVRRVVWRLAAAKGGTAARCMKGGGKG